MHRTHASWLQSREARNQAKQLKSLMYGLMAQSGDAGSRAADDLCHAREMAFVITDLEGSTAQASANAAAFGKVQEIHDTVRLRPLSALHFAKLPPPMRPPLARCRSFATPWAAEPQLSLLLLTLLRSQSPRSLFLLQVHVVPAIACTSL